MALQNSMQYNNFQVIASLFDGQGKQVSDDVVMHALRYVSQEDLFELENSSPHMMFLVNEKKYWLDFEKILNPKGERDEEQIYADVIETYARFVPACLPKVKHMRNVGYGIGLRPDLQTKFYELRNCFSAHAPHLTFLQLTECVKEKFSRTFKYFPNLKELAWNGLKVNKEGRFDKILKNMSSLRCIDLENIVLHPGICKLEMPMHIEEIHIRGLIYRHTVFIDELCQKGGEKPCPWRFKPSHTHKKDLFPFSLLDNPPKCLTKLSLDGLFHYNFPQEFDLDFDFNEFVKVFPQMTWFRLDDFHSKELKFLNVQALEKLTRLETLYVSTSKVTVKITQCHFADSLEVLVASIDSFCNVPVPVFKNLCMLKLEGLSQVQLVYDTVLKVIQNTQKLEILTLSSHILHDAPPGAMACQLLTPLADHLASLKHLDISQLYIVSWEDLRGFLTSLGTHPLRSQSLPLTICGRWSRILGLKEQDLTDDQLLSKLKSAIPKLRWMGGRLQIWDKFLRFICDEEMTPCASRANNVSAQSPTTSPRTYSPKPSFRSRKIVNV